MKSYPVCIPWWGLKPFFEKWEMRGIMEKAMLKKNGGIPKGCFSFGLCDSQKVFSDWYFKC